MVKAAVVWPLYVTTTFAEVDPANAYGTMTQVDDAEAYRMGAAVPLNVTLVEPTVVPRLPVVGIAKEARGEGPIVNPLITTTSPGAIAVAGTSLAPLLML